MNYTLAGHGLDDFLACANALHERRMLWSCGHGKDGGWAASTVDDAPLGVVLAVADAVDPSRERIGIYAAGEMVFTLDVLLATLITPTEGFWREVKGCAAAIDGLAPIERTR